VSIVDDENQKDDTVTASIKPSTISINDEDNDDVTSSVTS
jgi:hypothetical protein